MKYRGVVYDYDNEGFWKYTREYDCIELATEYANKIIKKFKVQNPKIMITNNHNPKTITII